MLGGVALAPTSCRVLRRPRPAASTSRPLTIKTRKEKQMNSPQNILRIYREGGYLLESVWNETGIAYPEAKRILIQAFRAESKPPIKGADWKNKHRMPFNLFTWIKYVHKHHSLRMVCDWLNWSPRAVLELCAACNAAGYPVIAPKIPYADMPWLADYDPELRPPYLRSLHKSKPSKGIYRPRNYKVCKAPVPLWHSKYDPGILAFLRS